ncbi:uncharacterized protein LOC141614340 [Silene latifolia]|uniref:uncharacterized protein LOC141614340 n=1 Tax=Silene latifolia TaxID=37657 RepID=UPI003D772FA0
MDCNCLVDKVVDRIRKLGARQLSYAGRVVLIKSVLSTLHSYWARIFILPKTVIRNIEAICRDYLWHGKEAGSKPALVAWSKICRSKKEGGLGFKDLLLWNCAALGKYVWWIEKKEDHLWVKWVHAIYIKGKQWKDYAPPVNSSWAWRKVCQTKDTLKDCIWSQNTSYSISLGYKWLLPFTENVGWYAWQLNSWMLPKHGFISWIIAHQRLLTQDRLINMNIAQQNRCYLCDLTSEDHEHLFFQCDYSSRCSSLVSQWCSFTLPDMDCISWWIALRLRTLTQKKVIGVILASLMYHIWMARNKSRIEHVMIRPEMVLAQVQYDVRARLMNCKINCTNARVVAWMNVLRSN